MVSQDIVLFRAALMAMPYRPIAKLDKPPRVAVCFTHHKAELSAEGTKAVAASLAGWLEPGDVVVLSGDLGAGKTTFTQGLALELGVTDPVTSPTFAILQQYDGTQHTQGSQRTLVINHLDVYRLGTLDEVEALGLDELLDGEAVTLVEWGEAIETLLGPSRLVVTLQLAPAKKPQ